jgi:hypothetical protein
VPPRPRQVRVEQRNALAVMQRLEQRSDAELEAETRHKAAALAILGTRASERYDAKAARSYFQRAIAAARPQERMQIRRMADASLALAERRPSDLKQAVERLGQAPPSNRQLLLLRLMGLLAPPPGSSPLLRARGVLIVLLIVVALLALGLGIVSLVAWPFGGVGLFWGIVLGVLVIAAVLGVLTLLGRRRQAKLKARARASGPPGARRA